MNIIIQPSLFDEIFPCSIIEAMACGKLVIGSKVAGIPEQIKDRKTGFLVNPGNVRQLTKAIIKNKIYQQIIFKLIFTVYEF
jgi:glycosyltransferase involved in cell wall biosynthesis